MGLFQMPLAFCIEMGSSPNGTKKIGMRKRIPIFGAGGGTRTHTVSLPKDFESSSSTIPTHRRMNIRKDVIWVSEAAQTGALHRLV